ncbi:MULTISPECIES: sensor domain-containing diguanylate cyclase [Psychrilyobacter]|uniref:Diguanylate cyclase n=1 Tax=Psychrilyobacter piezotolerans TaxID=2293438 RepID=A0ABX9KIH7_9FUSO|nr:MULTISPECIES: diguanylate cyclase [Psychrilyobacter]MCS5420603.1 diguanylate cyclase [Psychrilyobacter sp. S5]NDI77378.1 diguanylate cyclase [Psychrilyobacter piezotolerans]RDE63683.1 GGDEF domain-containing protein [Psychrilyobacter sp. S5]REI42027.1 diguanylate cyclase [Psychrilyobacter piezotolerans]
MNIKKKVIKISIISALIPIFFLGTYGYFLVKNKIDESEMEKIELMFHSQKSEFNLIFNKSKTLLNLAEILVSDYDELKGDKQNLNLMLGKVAADNTEIKNIFWGSDKGRIYTSNTNLPIDYDPRSRPWYIGSLRSKNNNLSTITYEFMDGKRGTTITKKVYSKDGIFKGVIGLDLNFCGLEKKLKEFALGKKVTIFIVDKFDSIVIDSEKNNENFLLIREYMENLFPVKFSKGNYYLRDVALSTDISRIKIDTPKGAVIFIKEYIPELELLMIGGVYEHELTETAHKIIISGLLFTLLGLTITSIIVNKFIKKLDSHIKIINTLIREISLGNYKNDEKKLLEFISEDSELNAIRKEVEVLQTNIEKRELNLKNSAITDCLTGVYNRKGLELCLSAAKKKYELFDDYNFSIIIFDIDDFKKINDTYGHIFGDKVLKLICKIFIENTDKNDQIYRYGGEEFIILVHNVNRKEAFRIGNRLRKIIEKYDFILTSNLEKLMKITVSGGIAEYERGLDIEQFIKKADVLLYQSKNSGKNKIIY